MLSRYHGLLLSALLTAPASTAASAACQGGTDLASYGGKTITVVDDALFFKTENVELDIDGSPSAYGVSDQGLDGICSGLGPLEPPDCKGKVRPQKCATACRQAFRNWTKNGGGDPATLKNWMCSIGLGGGGCSEPRVRLQEAPRQAWFVSESSVHVVPPSETSIKDWIKTQPAQLDAEAIPYFVIPSGFRKLPYDATLGDVGAILKAPNGTPIPFIVGDGGGNLDEGSAKLLAALRGLQKLPTETKTSALGKQVERLKGALEGDYRVVIFRHSGPLLSSDEGKEHHVLDKTAAELPAWITATVQAKLSAIGGAARIRACSGG